MFVWRAHLIAGLARLTDAGLGLGAEMGGCLGGSRYDLGTATWGWENGFDRDTWLRALATFQADPMYCPLINRYVDRMPDSNGECLTRTDMIRDHTWYRSNYFQDIHRSMGCDAGLVCFTSVPGERDQFSEVFLFRQIGDRDFSAREKAIVREAHAAVAPLLGGPLARFADPAPTALPPRARQVLRCLLEGDTDKQIATRLGITGQTVNGYTKAIFRHFRTRGRVELLARWVRRGWGSSCAWAADSAG